MSDRITNKVRDDITKIVVNNSGEKEKIKELEQKLIDIVKKTLQKQTNFKITAKMRPFLKFDDDFSVRAENGWYTLVRVKFDKPIPCLDYRDYVEYKNLSVAAKKVAEAIKKQKEKVETLRNETSRSLTRYHTFKALLIDIPEISSILDEIRPSLTTKAAPRDKTVAIKNIRKNLKKVGEPNVKTK